MELAHSMTHIGLPHVFGMLIFALDLVAIASVLLGRGTMGHKVLWIVLVLLLPIVGMVLYFLIGRRSEDRWRMTT